MLKYDDFCQEMTGIIEAFPSLKNRSRLSRIHSLLSGLPSEAVRQIIQDIGDSAKSTPTPNDFKEHAKVWRSQFFHKNGYYYGFEPSSETQKDHSCDFCFDCGIVKVKHNTPDDFLQLMRCSCDTGLKSSVKLPQFTSDAKAMFIRVAINPQWFNPNIAVSDDLDKMGFKVLNKFDEWKAIVRKSEKYWAGLGFVA